MLALRDWKVEHVGEAPGRAAFMEIFEQAFPNWPPTKEAVTNAFIRVGWTLKGPSIDVFPDSHPDYQLSEAFRTVSEPCKSLFELTSNCP